MRSLALVLIGVLLLAAVPTGPAAAETVTLTVTVENQNGAGVANAALNATWDGGSYEARSASNGKALLDVPAGATVSIAVEHDSYVRNHPKTVTDASERDVTVDVHNPATLSIIAEEDGSALSDATVAARKDGRIAAQGKTGDDGGFVAEDVEQGRYSVEVVKPGFRRVTTSVYASGTTEETVSLARDSTRLDLTVVDDHFTPPVPLENVTISFAGLSSSPATNDAGNATSFVPVNTVLEVTASKAGYATAQTTVSIGEAKASVTVRMNRAERLNVTPTSDVLVAGQSTWVFVTDEYGAPMANTSVSLDGESVGLTDGEGKIRVGVEAAGEHELVASTGEVTSDPVVLRAVSDEEADATTGAGGTAPTTGDDAQTTTPDEESVPNVGIPGFTGGLAAIAILLALGALVLVSRRGT